MKISYRSLDEVEQDIDNTMAQLTEAWLYYRNGIGEFEFEIWATALNRLGLYRAEHNIILLYGEKDAEDDEDNDD